MKVPFNINLSGKTAIVTGGSGTLCSAMAYGLAVCGAKVAIIGRNKEKLASVSEKLTKDALDEYNKNVIVKGYSCNVINKDELSAAYETIKNELGSCDILINGAGGNQPGAITSIEMLKKEKEDSDYSFWNLDEDRIRDVMDLNYMGTLLPIQVFTKDMVEKRSGSIINIASVTSILPLTKVMAYGNAKSAILNLTQWLAVHLVKAAYAAMQLRQDSTLLSRIMTSYSMQTEHTQTVPERLLPEHLWDALASLKSLLVLHSFLQVMKQPALSMV